MLEQGMCLSVYKHYTYKDCTMCECHVCGPGAAELTQKCGGTINLQDTFIPMDKICAPLVFWCLYVYVCHSMCACMCVYVSLSCHYVTVMCHYYV